VPVAKGGKGKRVKCFKATKLKRMAAGSKKCKGEKVKSRRVERGSSSTTLGQKKAEVGKENRNSARPDQKGSCSFARSGNTKKMDAGSGVMKGKRKGKRAWRGCTKKKTWFSRGY